MSVAKPSLLFYCQHSVGVGHLVRSFSLATTLTADWRVLFLNGGRLPAGIAVPAGVELIQLQPLGADEAGNLVSHDESASKPLSSGAGGRSSSASSASTRAC